LQPFLGATIVFRLSVCDPLSSFRKNVRRTKTPDLFFLLCLLFISSWAHAQKGLATLRGTITDSTGATLSDAIISLQDPDVGSVRTFTTKSNGTYEFQSLNPSTYQLRVSKQGFREISLDGLRLEDGRVSVKDLQMALGSASQEITVVDKPEVITADTGKLQSLFDEKRVLTTPTNDQNPGPEALLSSLPGIQANGYTVQIAGQNANQLVLNYDGLQNREGNQNVNINFYQEFTATSSNASAESASAVSENSTSKRGGNEFHGGAAYRMFNNTLNAKGYFDPHKTHSQMDEILGEIGGPVIKDKTFFYVGYMKQLYAAGSFNQATTPTLDQRNGVFTSTIKDPKTGLPFNHNTIPNDRISPVAQKLQSTYYPQPNQGKSNSSANNYGWTHPFPSDIYEGAWWFARIDQNITQKNSLSFRYSSKGAPYVLANNLPALFRTQERYNNQFTLADTHIFTPSVVNSFQVARNYLKLFGGETEQGQTPVSGANVISQIGLQGINTTGLDNIEGFPAMNISGYASLSTSTGGLSPAEHDWVFQDSLSWAFGRHVLKFGGNFINYNTFSGVIPDFGTFTFDGSFTGNAYADFLLGYPRTSKRSNPIYNQTYASKEAGLFAQDSFKINPRLTAEYGLRWDYYGVPYYTNELSYRWDLSTPHSLIVPSNSLSKVSPLFPSNISVIAGQVAPNAKLSNFRPRLSLAYRVASKTVVRGGYAEFTERFAINDRANQGGPFGIAETYTNINQPGTGPLFSFPNPFPASLSLAASPSQTVTGYPLDTDNGVIRQFNLTIEREIPANIGLRISYLGSQGSGLNYKANIDKPRPHNGAFVPGSQPYPEFNTVNYWFSNGSSRYNALQLEAQRRTGAFTFDAHYTFSNNTYNYANTENPYDILSHWSRDPMTRRHYAVVNTAFTLPFGRGQRFMNQAPHWVDTAFGNWAVQTISYFASGMYFTPMFSGGDPSGTNTFGGIPDRVPGVSLYPAHQGVRSWFNPAAFTTPQPGRFGNGGGNLVEGQGLISSDLSINKAFPLTERVKFSLTGAASNVFNHAHFNTLSTTLSAATAGQYTSVLPDYVGSRSGRRMMTIKARIDF
jgi:hypothetical protein